MQENPWKYKVFHCFKSYLVSSFISIFIGILHRPIGSKLARLSIFGGRCKCKQIPLCNFSWYEMIGNPIHSRAEALMSLDTILVCLIYHFKIDFSTSIKEKVKYSEEKQIGKQCKPVQVHSFSRFSLRCNLRKFACWGSIPNPLWTSSVDDGYTIFNRF